MATGSRRWKIFGSIVVVFAAAYYWLLLDDRMPADASYELDIAQLRQLAASLPGERASALRSEHVADFRFPGAVIAAGDGWGLQAMPVFSYQLVFGDHTMIIDAGLTPAQQEPAHASGFHADAYERMRAALARASTIVVTHEHADHFGGIAGDPELEKLLPALKITAEQLAKPAAGSPVEFPATLRAAYQPLVYDHYQAIAPGVVLIKAPGHTPGSQMVYVALADGQELLLLGDVAWHLGNVETQRERPRLITDLLIHEDRKAVYGQLKALQQLQRANPALHLVPGHDGAVIGALQQAGVIQAGFAL